MNWIERAFAIHPDNGSGAVEIAIACAAVCVFLWMSVRHARHRRSRPR